MIEVLNDDGQTVGMMPEEYAAMWGCDPQYDRAPRQPGDGYLFYNFGSERQKRTKAWLTEFLGAIDRTIAEVETRDEPRDNDLDELRQLRNHVQELQRQAN